MSQKSCECVTAKSNTHKPLSAALSPGVASAPSSETSADRLAEPACRQAPGSRQTHYFRAIG